MNLQPVGKDKINHISNEDLENELIWWANQRDYNLSKTVAHNLMTPRLKRLWSFIIRLYPNSVVNKLKKLDISDLIMLNNTELLANYKKEKLSTSNQQLRKSELLSKLYQLKRDLKDQNDKVDQLFNITSEKELSLRQSENDLLDVQSRLQIKMEHKKSLILLIHKIKSMNDSLQRVGKQESIGLQENILSELKQYVKSSITGEQPVNDVFREHLDHFRFVSKPHLLNSLNEKDRLNTIKLSNLHNTIETISRRTNIKSQGYLDNCYVEHVDRYVAVLKKMHSLEETLKNYHCAKTRFEKLKHLNMDKNFKTFTEVEQIVQRDVETRCKNVVNTVQNDYCKMKIEKQTLDDLKFSLEESSDRLQAQLQIGHSVLEEISNMMDGFSIDLENCVRNSKRTIDLLDSLTMSQSTTHEQLRTMRLGFDEFNLQYYIEKSSSKSSEKFDRCFTWNTDPTLHTMKQIFGIPAFNNIESFISRIEQMKQEDKSQNGVVESLQLRKHQFDNFEIDINEKIRTASNIIEKLRHYYDSNQLPKIMEMISSSKKCLDTCSSIEEAIQMRNWFLENRDELFETFEWINENFDE